MKLKLRDLKIGDLVRINTLGLAHKIQIMNGHAVAEELYTISSKSKHGFYVERFFYDIDDVIEHYTKENNPEYFL